MKTTIDEEIERRLERGETLFVAAHILVEAYAVCRLNPPTADR